MSAADRLVFRNTMHITPGHLEPFRRAVHRAVEFAERHAPQLLVDVFIDETELTCTSFQIYADSDAVLRHWELSDPYIQDVMEHCVVGRFEVFGDPSDAVRAGLPPAVGGSVVTVTPRLTGYRAVGSAAPAPR
jgi:hypothetical protein